MVLALILAFLTLSSDPALFHRPDPIMARGEAKFAEMLGGTGAFALVPLEEWQEKNRRLVNIFDDRAGGEILEASDLPRELTLSFDGTDFLILPESIADVLAPEAQPINLKDLLAALFAQLTMRLVAVLATFGLLPIICALVFRRRLGIFSPIFAVGATALTLGLFGEPITLFHLLSFFVIYGLGVDYAIFRNRIVFYSFLTSLLGFGLLAFTSFPPTAAIGKTIAVGLSYAYLFSLFRAPAPTSTSTPTPTSTSTPSWATQKEQAAGKFRLKLTFAFYRLFGKSFCKLCAVFVVACAYPGFRKRCSFRKALSFAFGLLDKLDACTLRKNLPKMTILGDTNWMKGGAFLLSTHVGTIEVLPALKNVDGIVVHAFQQMTHNKLFTEMFLKHFDKRQFVLHPVEEIGIETAVEMQEAIRRGEMVLMAGDRDPASGGKKGVFKFAKLMEAPVYAIACIRTGWNAYTVNAKELDRRALQAEYDAFLADASSAYPNEHFEF